MTTPDAYVDAALRLAADRGRIITLRKSLRRKVERILFDPAPHVAELEIAYEEMVRRLRSQEPTTAFSVSNPLGLSRTTTKDRKSLNQKPNDNVPTDKLWDTDPKN